MNPETDAIDPVCGMTVKKARAAKPHQKKQDGPGASRKAKSQAAGEEKARKSRVATQKGSEPSSNMVRAGFGPGFMIPLKRDSD